MKTLEEKLLDKSYKKAYDRALEILDSLKSANYYALSHINAEMIANHSWRYYNEM